MLWGGPRLVTFVAMNICGPEVHSIYRWHNKQSGIGGGIQARNFKKLSDIYTYNETSNILFFCGMIGNNHQCPDHFGDGEEGYNA